MTPHRSLVYVVRPTDCVQRLDSRYCIIQEDAACFVYACFQSHLAGTLRSGTHYFVISDNTYNIFDIETPRREIGYQPVHNAECFYQ